MHVFVEENSCLNSIFFFSLILPGIFCSEYISMSVPKCHISLIVLFSFLSAEAFSQAISYNDTLTLDHSEQFKPKPRMVYSVGSTFMFIPHHGSVTGFTVSPSLSVPVSPHLSFNGGIIAGRYYSDLQYPTQEVPMYGAFNEMSLFGSATYHINAQLTFYGAGIKRLTAPSPFNTLPTSSYIIGSTYKFGSFSIGVTMQMSQWNNNFNSLPINSHQVFFSPFRQSQGMW